MNATQAPLPVPGPHWPAALARSYLTLTPDQKAAVAHDHGPLLIFAGPGAGKTATLTTRIGRLLASGLAGPGEILAVTFTVRAADEMRVRLIDLIGRDRGRTVTICTFHSLCARILRRHAHAFGRDEQYTIYDQHDLARVAAHLAQDPGRERLRRLIAHHGPAPVTEAVGEISLAKSRLWTPATYREHAAHPAAALIAELWAELERELRESNCFDFDDLIANTVALLVRHDGVRAHYRSRWPFVLVDEFQDTGDAQMALVQLLTGPRGNLTVVGDDDQAIFAFSGADVANILRFADRFRAARTIVLGLNFRCRTEILTAAVATVAHNSTRAPKELVAARGPGGRITRRHFGDDRQEARFVARVVADALSRGVDPGDIQILCRNSLPTLATRQALDRAGIRYRLIGGLSMWERTEVKDAIAYLTLVLNPHDSVAFRRAVAAPTDRKPFHAGKVTAPSRGAGTAAQNHVIEHARSHRQDLLTACASAAAISAIRQARTREQLAAFGRQLSVIRAGRRRGLARTVVETVMIDGGVVRTYQQLRDGAQDPAIRADANRVLEDLRSFCRAAQTFEARHPAAGLAGWLEWVSLTSRGELDAEHDDRITVSTIHGAKGTEASLVIVIGLEERLLPGWRALEHPDPGQIEDERRLFYVALTRAKDELVLCHSARRGDRDSDVPSRFLTEAGL